LQRVVTRINKAGRPAVAFCGEPSKIEDFGLTEAIELWMTQAAPFGPAGDGDPTVGDWQLEPPPGGTIFRIATHQPGEEVPVHATATVDYVVVLSGELVLLLGDQEIALQAGDTVVQQGTPHGWANRSSEPCAVAAVLLSTKVQ
jgi:quercetin dioxygenase-like cupin family protein